MAKKKGNNPDKVEDLMICGGFVHIKKKFGMLATFSEHYTTLSKPTAITVNHERIGRGRVTGRKERRGLLG